VARMGASDIVSARLSRSFQGWNLGKTTRCGGPPGNQPGVVESVD
jgi:hypothetical protein